MRKKSKHGALPPRPPSTSSYSVGYCKPPIHSRFPPGRSGNPKGRPKGRLNLETAFNNELNRVVTIREGDRSRRIKKGAAWVVRTVNGALNNEPKANVTFLSLLRAFPSSRAPEESPEYPLDLKMLTTDELLELERLVTKASSGSTRDQK